MVDVPAAIAETKPVLEIVATTVLEDVHGFTAAAVAVPDNCDVDPIHALNVPLITGIAFTVNVAVTKHPLLFV